MSQRRSEGLPVLGEDGYLLDEPSAEGWTRSGSSSRAQARPSSSGSRPLSSSLSRRTPTPTKQIQLQAVKRKEDKFHCEEKIDWEDLNSALSQEAERRLSLNGDVDDDVEGATGFQPPTREYSWQSNLRNYDDSQGHIGNVDRKGENIRKIDPPKQTQSTAKDKPEEEQEDSSDSDDDDDSEEEKEKQKVPMQLIMEFLTCLMEKDYLNAAKLCKMILIYDPTNAKALEFQPLIDEKMQLEEDLKNQSDDSDSEDDDDDDDDSGDESDDSDSDDDDDENDDQDNPSQSDSDDDKVDSGIASANSD